MNIKNTKFLIVLIFSLLSFNKVYANVYINEVEIVPTEGRFIELYNSSSSSVDLTNWYIQRKTATGTSFSSLISKTYFEGKSIGANSYFVISKSDINNSDLVFSKLTLTESNIIQLKNASQEVTDIVGWGEIDGSLVSNPSEGKSIQRYSNGDWLISNPTPGVGNDSSSDSNDSEGDEEYNKEEDDDDSVEEDNNIKDIFKITTKINTPKVITAGIPFSFYSTTNDNKGITYNVGRFVWNFGDGTKIESKDCGPFEYVYEYAGDYIINLSYFSNSFAEIPDAIDKLTIKVIPADIYISSVGNYSDPFVEIENKSKYEVDLSGWNIFTSSKVFSFPNSTTILKGNKIKISPKVTNFTGDDLKYLIIQNPRGDIVATYPLANRKLVIANTNKNISSSVSKNNGEEKQEGIKEKNTQEIINLNDLRASASDSNQKISSKWLPLFGLIGIISLGVVSFLVLKIKHKEEGNIEKEISADDIKIIE